MQKKIKSKLIYVGRSQPAFYSLSTENYAQYTQLYTIIGEVTKLLLRKVQVNPNHLIQQYTSQHLKGEHVLLKSYNNFSKSPLNRLCFVSNFVKVFDIQETSNNNGSNTNTNNGKNGFDYLQLLRLVCSDFPKDIVMQSLRLCVKDWNSEQEIILQRNYESSGFIRSFFMFFMYGDFLKTLEKSQKIKLKDFYGIVKDNNNMKNFNKQFERPSFRVLINIILKISRYQTKQVMFVTQQTIESYLTNQILTYNQILQTLFDSTINNNEIESRLQLAQQVNGRISQIYKITSQKVMDNGEQKSGVGKKGKKK